MCAVSVTNAYVVLALCEDVREGKKAKKRRRRSCVELRGVCRGRECYIVFVCYKFGLGCSVCGGEGEGEGGGLCMWVIGKVQSELLQRDKELVINVFPKRLCRGPRGCVGIRCVVCEVMLYSAWRLWEMVGEG